MVHYQGTRVHPRLGIDQQLVTPVELPALLVPHITRLYGAISKRIRRRLGWIEHLPTCKQPPEYGPAPDLSPSAGTLRP